jgi:hypothetical protein
MLDLVAPAQRRTDAAEHRRLCEARGFPVPPWETPEERAAVDDFVAARPRGTTIEHIAPLGHPEIIGLHVRANLAYLTPVENNAKSNRLPEGLTPAEAVGCGLAVWRRDVRPDGSVDWSKYSKETSR